jgi:hypothetical protein
MGTVHGYSIQNCYTTNMETYLSWVQLVDKGGGIDVRLDV